MTKHRIIIDCDPGRDDAIAIALALASPKNIEILGITTVAGNVPLPLTSRNARLICDLAGYPNTPVYAGESAPLSVDLITAENVHGNTGLDGIEIFEPKAPLQSEHAVDFIKATLEQAGDNSVTLVTIGPLTNIARVVSETPELLLKVKQLVIMGGARNECGNITPTAEFNFYVDPHAAHIVLGCGRPITVFSLDATYQALAKPVHMEKLREIGSPIALSFASLFGSDAFSNPEKFGENNIPLHDPCTISWLLWPELFQGHDVHAHVDTRQGPTFGMSIVDRWRKTTHAPNVMWIDTIDAGTMMDRILNRIATL